MTDLWEGSAPKRVCRSETVCETYVVEGMIGTRRGGVKEPSQTYCLALWTPNRF